MATKVKTYRINVDASAQKGDAIVIGENGAMTAQHLGTVASKDTGTSAGNIPILDEEGKLADSTMSSNTMKKNVYDPTGKSRDAFDYRNFDNTPEIPEVYDPVITFTQGGVSKGSISLNQAGTATIALDAGGVEAGKGISIIENKVAVEYDNDTIKLKDNNKLYVDVDDELSSSSELPVQNKVVQSAISGLSTDIDNVDAKFADYTPTASLSAVALSNDYDDLDDKPYIPDVIDALDSTATNKALSANQGKVLKGMIDDMAAIGKFLSLWDSSSGEPISFPKEIPYTYNTGDYYMVSVVDTTAPIANYKPTGSSYDGTASSTAETGEVEIGDLYIYDGTTWLLQLNHGKAVSFANLTGLPSDNVSLGLALDAKADVSSLATVATSGSYTDLSNTPIIPTVNDSTITIQKNSTTVDSFTLNQSSAKTIDISVPTTVAELTDASDYATVASLGAVATSNSYTDLDNKPSIPTALSAGNAIDISSNKVNVVVDDSTIKIDSNTNKLYYNNSAGYITKDVNDLTNYTKSSDLADVATSGAYSDLNGTPSLATVATSGDYTDLTNTPSLATVATSGDYTDLTNTPNLATVATSGAYSDLTGTPSIPSKTSDLTNDSGFITDSDINTKMFELSSTSDLTTANAILAYANDGKNPVIKYNNALYILHSKSSSQLSFRSGMTTVAGTSDTTISQYTIVFNISNSSVATISATTSSLGKYLETDRNYSSPLTPSYNGSPATKKYVDDGLGGKQDTLIAGTGIDITNNVISNTQTSAEWGNITGTLSDQTDLNTALSAKANDNDVLHLSAGAETVISNTTDGLKSYKNGFQLISPDGTNTATVSVTDGGTMSFNAAVSTIAFTTTSNGKVAPNTSGSGKVNLGGGNNRWKDLYLSGNINKGGETITIPTATGTIALTSDLPTDTSDLTNGAGFITNAVDNLTNYYKKTETYTQAEVNSLVQNFQGFEVVATLPTTDIKTNVIYLLGPTGSGADKYEEYIYSNSTWIKIGDTSVDLTNYFNKATQTSDAITEGSTNLFLTSSERTILGNTSGTNTGDQTASDFDIKDLTDSTGLRTTWDGKQDALSTQTAYTSKGSSTKVPQITTNTLGQVTGITEVTITQPDISGKADKTEVLTKTNTTSFTPTGDYHPATKKYVDDSVAQAGGGDMLASVYDPNGKSADAFDYTNFINTPSIPSKTSDLNNDSGFITSSSLPTKVSDLQNDSGFITNAVDNLTNYYKKSETYTQTEVNSLVQNFQGFEIVATLPTTNIKTNVIYLLGPTGSGVDKYEEYVYSSSTWVKIGDTSVDLTNYFNKATNTSDNITEGSTNLFLTSSERTLLSNTSGTNTGDQSASDFDIKDLTDSTSLRITWSGKQDALVSGTNIKTINSTSILGSGDISLNDVKTGSTAPTNPTEGMVWYDTTNDVIKTYDGSNWNEVKGGIESTNNTYDNVIYLSQSEYDNLGTYDANTLYSTPDGEAGTFVDDTAYSSSWDGVTDTAPSKNAVYDKISSMDTTIAGKQDLVSGGTGINVSSNIISIDSTVARTDEVLTLTNTTAYTPTTTYHPTTKGYVDGMIPTVMTQAEYDLITPISGKIYFIKES